MARQPLPDVPAASDVFIDANIFIYALSGASDECRAFLERCSREELIGISCFPVVNDTTHRLMLAEAKSKGLIREARASLLKTNRHIVPQLTDYWLQTERVLSMGVLLLGTDGIGAAECAARAKHGIVAGQ